MNKIDKLLSRTISTYFVVLIGIFVLKMFGLDYFGLDTNNGILCKINDFILNYKLESIWYCITLYINTYIIFSITCNDNSKKMKQFTLITMPLNMVIQYIKTNYNFPFLFVFTDFLYLITLSLCYIYIIKRDKIQKENITNYFIFTIITISFQFINLVTRNVEINYHEDSFIMSLIMNIDYFTLLIMFYKLYFIKGGSDLWVGVLGFSSVLQTSLRSFPVKLRQSYQDAKPKTQEDALADKIYLVLFWLYNFFTVVVILLIATLNHTFVECIFILTSFWMNKGAFGKPFHLKKASTCFIVSTLSYYVLNRITWGVGLSFLIPTSLGILLSYITSLIMTKYETTRLYQGMPEEDFYNLINKVTDNKEHIEICRKFYVEKYTNVKLSYEFNYSVSNINKIKQKINGNIKEL